MKLIYIFLICLISTNGFCQFHEPVFPTLDGEQLRSAIIENYKTSTVLSYSEARDTFMKNIDAVDNQLECVYSGYTITLDPKLDPTTDAFNQDINTEHTFPRSKGAQENTLGYSDMHHLFPTRAKVNTDRSNLPFQDITDSQTERWYIDDLVVTNIPNTNVDAYSEYLSNVGFEPREEHKGDVARAYFYFYTMYKASADLSDPDFFESQRESMCAWMFQDPVDQKEWDRNNKIAPYQDDKKNPFILDCRLARLYCDDITEACLSVNTDDRTQTRLIISPNPTMSSLRVDFSIDSDYNIHVVNALGQTVQLSFVEENSNGILMDVSDLDNGIYYLQIISRGKVLGNARFIKL